MDEEGSASGEEDVSGSDGSRLDPPDPVAPADGSSQRWRRSGDSGGSGDEEGIAATDPAWINLTDDGSDLK